MTHIIPYFLEVILICNYEMFTLVLRRYCGCVFFNYVQRELMSKTKSSVSFADHYSHFRNFYLNFLLIAEWAREIQEIQYFVYSYIFNAKFRLCN
jgi:hypothetical protein